MCAYAHARVRVIADSGENIFWCARKYSRFIMLNMPLVFLDTETTGLDAKENRIIQCFAKIPQLGESINLEMNPGDGRIDDEALAINGKTRKELLTRGLTQKQGAIQLAQWIYEHVGTRAEVVCHNSPFDREFVMQWFKREGVSFKRSFHYQWQCTMHVAMFLRSRKLASPRSLKLVDLCSYYGIKLDTASLHEAGADVDATIELYHVFHNLVQPLK